MKRVRAQSKGLVPGRGGRRVDVTPVYISRSLQMGTTKNLAPKFLPFTIKSALTKDTLGTPKPEVEAGTNLQIMTSVYSNRNR